MLKLGIDLDKLTQLAVEEAALTILRWQVAPEDRIAGHLSSHRADFDIAALAILRVGDDADRALALAAEIDAGRAEFCGVAEEVIRELGMVPGTRGPVSSLVSYRRDLPPTLHGVFSAEPGAVLGPILHDGNQTLVRVVELKTACLDESTRQATQHLLFEDWLQERREAADVEWYWGRRGRTATA